MSAHVPTQPLLEVSPGQSQHNSHLDVFLQLAALPAEFDELEITLSLYPYQRHITADNFNFSPYEDYVADLVAGKRSTYEHQKSAAAAIFGLLLGGAILAYFGWFFPSLLLSVESIVSVFAAYTVGKEIWDDLDEFCQNLTQGWSWRWLPPTFFYSLQRFGTLQRFWQLARYQRYGYRLTLPQHLDFISHSNSKTVEMSFTRDLIKTITNHQMRIMSINFTDTSAEVMLKHSLVISRVSVVKKGLGWKHGREWFQSLDKGQPGTLDLKNVWHAHQTLEKNFIAFGRLIWFWKSAHLIEFPVVGSAAKT